MRGSLSRSANHEGGEVFGRLRRFVRLQNLRIFAHFCSRSPCGWLICFLGCFCRLRGGVACTARTRPARVRNVQTTFIKQDNKPSKISVLCYSKPTHLQAKLKRRVKHIILSFSLFCPFRKSSRLFSFCFYFQSCSKRKSSYIFFFCLN